MRVNFINYPNYCKRCGKELTNTDIKVKCRICINCKLKDVEKNEEFYKYIQSLKRPEQRK